MNNKFPVHLVDIEISVNGTRKFVRRKEPYTKRIWGTSYDRFVFKLRRTYFNEPNCNFNCPPGKEFYCCVHFGCKAHGGFFEWGETSFFSEEESQKILSLWDDEKGFLRKDGCILPRELRSMICLAFVCKGSHPKE